MIRALELVPLLILALMPFHECSVRAETIQGTATLEPPSKAEGGLDLEFPLRAVPVRLRAESGRDALQAEIRGLFKAKDWSLVQGKKRMVLSGNGQFTDDLELTGPETRAEFIGIALDGTVGRLKVIVRYPGWEAFSRWREADAFRRGRLRIWASVGVSQSAMDTSDPGQASSASFKSLTPLSFGAGAFYPLANDSFRISGSFRSIPGQVQAQNGITLSPSSFRSSLLDLQLTYLPAAWAISVSTTGFLHTGVEAGLQLQDGALIRIGSPLTAALAQGRRLSADATRLRLSFLESWEAELAFKIHYPVVKLGSLQTSGGLHWEGDCGLARWLGERFLLGVRFTAISDVFDLNTDADGYSSTGRQSQLFLDTQLRLDYRL